ncbi:MAG: hypothetical protein P4L72_11845 [Parvibaculum sp.]|jgi:hypothetical protein|uniref:hypothetical protein n=1 Tax=Parvibaculum sp. TaxID=2024848 RepID=UPI00284D192F|nr:hypothetical protein [Parvibaculum sp.]MDR3499905.1 hypothetical protein [Parvibaculum sp.]
MVEIDRTKIWGLALSAWSAVEPVLTSETAMRIYVLAVGAAILIWALYQAYLEHKFLDGISVDDFTKRFPGPRPKDPGVQQARLKAYRAEKWKEIWSRLRWLAACGFVLPILFLCATSYFYNWFDGTHTAFVNLETHNEVRDVTVGDVTQFVGDQILGATALDFFEVFHVEIGNLTNDGRNYLFSGVVFGLRSFISIYLGAIFLYLSRVALIMWQLRRESDSKAPQTVTASPAS